MANQGTTIVSQPEVRTEKTERAKEYRTKAKNRNQKLHTKLCFLASSFSKKCEQRLEQLNP